MSYGIGIYDAKGVLSLTDGWYPMSYKGTISFTVGYISAPDVVRSFSIPAGCTVVIQPAGPSVQHIAAGGGFSGYVLGSYISGGTVTIRQQLWYGYSGSPLIGQVVNFNVYAYYPSTANSGDYGAFFAGSGVSVALTNTNTLNVLRFKGEWNTASSDFTVSTGISASEPEPSIYLSDTGYNCTACYVFNSGGIWHVRILRNGGLYKIDFTVSSEPPRNGLVRLAAFSKPIQSVSGWGFALYGQDGSVAFTSSQRPEMPRGFLYSPSPSISGPPGTSAWSAIADANPQAVPSFGIIKPMIKARIIGISKISFLPFPIGTWLKSNGVFTCGVMYKGEGSMPVGSTFGYWGENSSNSPIQYINEYDYF